MTRSFLAILLVGLALLLGGIVMGGARRAAAPLPAVRVAPRLMPGMGVTVALDRYDPQQRAATLDAIAASGFAWARQRFPWDAIEPEPGVFNWQPWDGIVDDVTRRGLTLVAVLDGSPGWARAAEDGDNALAPPRQRADFGRFVAAFAERYGQDVQVYQVWDEPNIRPHWGHGLVDAAGYAGLLREAAVQLRAADPDALVLVAALAPNTEPGGLNQSDLAYFDELYRAGAAPWFDVAAAQPYGFDQPPAAPPSPDTLNFRRAELLREVMLRHDDGQTPLWAVAYGWNAPVDSQAESPSPWKSVDEATQAAWAVDAAGWAQREWPWLGGLAWAWWQPPAAAADPHWGFALRTPQDDDRPVLSALQDWLRQPSALSPGQWPPNAPGIEEEGGWRLTNQAADPPHGAQADNNRLRLPFDGTGLALRIQRGPYWGYFDVTVDGQPAAALPKDGEGRAILVLHDPLAGQETVVVADQLPEGRHVAEIVATGGWEQWPLLGLDVWRGAAPSGTQRLPWLLAAAGLVLTGLGAAGLVATRRPRTGIAFATTVQGALDRAQLAPPAMRFALVAVTALVAGLAPGWLQLPALGVLLALFVAFSETGPALLAFLAPLFLVTVSVLGRQMSPTEAVAWLAALALAGRWWVAWAAGHRVRGPIRLLPLDWPILALPVVSVVSLFGAQEVGVALHELRTVILTGMLAYGLVRLSPATASNGQVDPWPVAWGLGLGAAVVAGWGIVQAATGSHVIAAEGVVRVRGPYGSPNNLALYLDHVLPILVAVALFARQRSRRLAAALLALVVLAGLVLTFSRGALLLGLPAALLFLGFAAGGRWRWVALALLAGGFLLMLPLFRIERFASLLDLQGGTSFLRIQLWRGAWNMILDHPLLGVGLDNFLYAYRTRYVLPAGWQELNLSHPHTILLDFWTRLGALGVIVGTWLFAAAFWQGWPARRRLSDDRRALLIGLLASLVATIAHGLIDNSVFLVDLMLVWMLSLGLIARLSVEQSPD